MNGISSAICCRGRLRRHAEAVGECFGDLPDGHALLSSGVQDRAGGGVLQPEPDQACGVGPVDGGPAVAAIAGVDGCAASPGGLGDDGDEAVVAFAVDGRGEAGGDDAYAPVCVGQGQVLGAAARCVRADGGIGVPLRRRASEAGHGEAGREHEGPVGPRERVADGLDRGPLGVVGELGVGPVVLVGEVDHTVGRLRGLADLVEVVEVAEVDDRPEVLDDRCRCLGAGQAGHLVPGGDELGDDGTPDESGCSGDEDVHGMLSLVMSGADVIDHSTDVRFCHHSFGPVTMRAWHVGHPGRRIVCSGRR